MGTAMASTSRCTSGSRSAVITTAGIVGAEVGAHHADGIGAGAAVEMVVRDQRRRPTTAPAQQADRDLRRGCGEHDIAPPLQQHLHALADGGLVLDDHQQGAPGSRRGCGLRARRRQRRTERAPPAGKARTASRGPARTARATDARACARSARRSQAPDRKPRSRCSASTPSRRNSSKISACCSLRDADARVDHVDAKARTRHGARRSARRRAACSGSHSTRGS